MAADIPPAEQSVNQMVATIHGIASSHAPVEVSLGLVISLPPDIQIAWNNIILTKEQLYIDAFLLKGYGRFANGDTNLPNAVGKTDIPSARGNLRTNTQSKRGGFGKPSFVHHFHKISNSYKGSLNGRYSADISSDYYSSMVFTDWGLNVGDLVCLLPISGGQQFVILGKVFYCADFSAATFSDKHKPTSRVF